ncbi:MULTISPECIES: short-chain dehydrogenase [unclassified Streptomyces]|uniref:short-chain dehydrogenase n=1 Tax=unclassified Streptomyces TaxID=2593676 RepID=UPI0016616A05|nr:MULTISPECIES: short-chain dehydrogenase [unclassified Streptomyces]MBD0711135.1 hypothetical protein [Streptomyces sp. CBMA291]MBD0714166.1 hypothetical protein [Streptomyces sp. CBMA370]
MNTCGASALVTGAIGGPGRAFALGLPTRDARTLYAAARGPKAVTGPGLTPLPRRITDPAPVPTADERCPATTLVVDNTRIARDGSPLSAEYLDGACDQPETDLFGPLAMCRASAPVLGKSDSGALVNVLSVLSWHTLPQIGSPKATAWSMTRSVRESPRAQDPFTIAGHTAFIDTGTATHGGQTKISPADLAGLADREEALTIDVTRQARSTLSRGANHDH